MCYTWFSDFLILNGVDDRQEHVLERYAGDGGFTHVYFGRKVRDIFLEVGKSIV